MYWWWAAHWHTPIMNDVHVEKGVCLIMVFSGGTNMLMDRIPIWCLGCRIPAIAQIFMCHLHMDIHAIWICMFRKFLECRGPYLPMIWKWLQRTQLECPEIPRIIVDDDGWWPIYPRVDVLLAGTCVPACKVLGCGHDILLAYGDWWDTWYSLCSQCAGMLEKNSLAPLGLIYDDKHMYWKFIHVWGQ
jgi:hypothetical protein